MTVILGELNVNDHVSFDKTQSTILGYDKKKDFDCELFSYTYEEAGSYKVLVNLSKFLPISRSQMRGDYRAVINDESFPSLLRLIDYDERNSALLSKRINLFENICVAMERPVPIVTSHSELVSAYVNNFPFLKAESAIDEELEIAFASEAVELTESVEAAVVETGEFSGKLFSSVDAGVGYMAASEGQPDLEHEQNCRDYTAAVLFQSADVISIVKKNLFGEEYDLNDRFQHGHCSLSAFTLSFARFLWVTFEDYPRILDYEWWKKVNEKLVDGCFSEFVAVDVMNRVVHFRAVSKDFPGRKYPTRAVWFSLREFYESLASGLPVVFDDTGGVFKNFSDTVHRNVCRDDRISDYGSPCERRDFVGNVRKDKIIVTGLHDGNGVLESRVLRFRLSASEAFVSIRDGSFGHPEFKKIFSLLKEMESQIVSIASLGNNIALAKRCVLAVEQLLSYYCSGTGINVTNVEQAFVKTFRSLIQVFNNNVDVVMWLKEKAKEHQWLLRCG